MLSTVQITSRCAVAPLQSSYITSLNRSNGVEHRVQHPIATPLPYPVGEVYGKLITNESGQLNWLIRDRGEKPNSNYADTLLHQGPHSSLAHENLDIRDPSLRLPTDSKFVPSFNLANLYGVSNAPSVYGLNAILLNCKSVQVFISWKILNSWVYYGNAVPTVASMSKEFICFVLPQFHPVLYTYGKEHILNQKSIQFCIRTRKFI